ncbi:MAG: hypothetical protein C0404_04735 [Verrucomicrobia bacterium]|nr:hypothetical protein [Verrucomicrobiota bacterium]
MKTISRTLQNLDSPEVERYGGLVMRTVSRLAITIAVIPVMLVGLPLLGIILAGRDLAAYTEFPPLTRYVPHAGFSWPAFIAMAAGILAVILVFDIKVLQAMMRRRVKNGEAVSPATGAFPWWGWIGVVSMAASWTFAWTRFNWFTGFQPFTFSPLWFSYIVLVNAVTYWRSGRCMLTHRTAYSMMLFPVSAGFWWFFEYLNRFVQNWYYQAVGALTPFEYFIFATLPFSTVLPAVLGTFDLLKSFRWAGIGLDNFLPVRLRRPGLMAWLTLAVCSAGLAGIGIWPDYLFPLLWLSPLFIVTSISTLLGRRTVFSDIRSGNWRNVYLLAMSALVCGFFWEMWNYYSLARWVYAVPFVEKFKVFEMPLLGYAGYLPFGLECAVIGSLVAELTGLLTGKGGIQDEN